MRTFNFFSLCILFVFLFSCREKSEQNNDEILKTDKITFTVISGNKGGGESALTITKDSVFYESNNRLSPQNNKKIKRKSPEDLWKNLLNNLVIRDFKHVKSNPGHIHDDGSDAETTIYLKGKTYLVINPEDDKINFGKIKNFYSIIESIHYKMADGYGLSGKTFSANIETVCQETTLPDPCAGFQIFLQLEFSELEVEISQKTISTCGKVEYTNKYFSEWHYEKSDKIVIENLVYDKQPIIEKNTFKNNFNEKKLTGISTDKSREYIFEEVQ